MDKEAVVYIYIQWKLLSHKKEHWVHFNEVDKPRAYYTEWSKSKREKQISYINAYLWNQERWYWWAYSQSSNRKNKLVEKGGEDEGQGEMNGESSMEAYTLPYVNR